MTVRSFLVPAAGAVAVGLMLFVVGCLWRSSPKAGDENNPLGPNAACYVCHMTYVKEPMSRVHLKHKVYCVNCHGISAPHANDEDIGATKPDIYFKRNQIDASCRKCHSTHNAAPAKVVARWFERKLTTSPPVCTDCHGRHKIKRAKAAKPAAAAFPPALPPDRTWRLTRKSVLSEKLSSLPKNCPLEMDRFAD